MQSVPQSILQFKKKKGSTLACNYSGGSLIPRGNMNIWVMEILKKTCWMTLLMWSVANSFYLWRETTLMTKLLFSEQQLCIFSTPQLQPFAIKLCGLTLYLFCTRFLTFCGFQPIFPEDLQKINPHHHLCIRRQPRLRRKSVSVRMSSCLGLSPLQFSQLSGTCNFLLSFLSVFFFLTLLWNTATWKLMKRLFSTWYRV